MRNLPHWLWPLVALLLGLAACIGSPQPSPPNLETEFLGTQRGGATDIVEGVRVFGTDGSVLPAVGTVVVTVLDGEPSVVAEPVQADGSFELVLPTAVLGDEIRVQVRNGAARSEPIDRRIGDGLLEVVERDACFTASLEEDAGEVEVGGGRELSVELTNNCTEARTVAAVLRGVGPFAITRSPTTLMPGSDDEVRLTVTPDATGTLEQTLFIEASTDEPDRPPDRHPVTLFVTGTP